MSTTGVRGADVTNRLPEVRSRVGVAGHSQFGLAERSVQGRIDRVSASGLDSCLPEASVARLWLA